MGLKLEEYPVLMLDMNGTFMFGQDRFGSEEDFFATYKTLGGRKLSTKEVFCIINDCILMMTALDADASVFDQFPSVAEVLRRTQFGLVCSEQELKLLEQVLAHHELGYVPDAMTSVLQTLARRHVLVLVSNIWCQKDIWVDYLTETNVLPLFTTTIFSSEHGCIKPGGRIYQTALDSVSASPEEVVFIGDNPICDVDAPRKLGMKTIHIKAANVVAGTADRVVQSLTSLLD